MKPAERRAKKPAPPRPVRVRLPITLGQFLKVADLVSSGGEAKLVIAEGSVRVNGEVDRRRGRKLLGGDVVQAAGVSAMVVLAGDESPGPLSRAASVGDESTPPASHVPGSGR